MSNFQPLEVVDRGSETQSQVVANLNKLGSTVQPVHTGSCTNRNPVYTVIIIWSRINYTQNNTN